MLVLERMGQLVGHHRELFLHRNPVGDVQGPGFGIVVSGHLFGEQLEQGSAIVQGLRNQAQFHQKAPVELEFLGRILFSHPAEDIAPDLLAALESGADGSRSGKVSERTDLGQDRIRGPAQLVRFRCRPLRRSDRRGFPRTGALRRV